MPMRGPQDDPWDLHSRSGMTARCRNTKMRLRAMALFGQAGRKAVAIRNRRRLERGTPFPVCRFTGAYRAEPSALRAPAKLVLAVGCILAIAGLFALAYRPAIAKRDSPPQTFPPQYVIAGARLA